MLKMVKTSVTAATPTTLTLLSCGMMCMYLCPVFKAASGCVGLEELGKSSMHAGLTQQPVLHMQYRPCTPRGWLYVYPL